MRVPVGALFSLLALPWAASGELVFPAPREIQLSARDFDVDGGAALLLPMQPSAADLRLGNLITAELGDRHGVALRREFASRLPARRFILAGSIANPLIREYCLKNNLKLSPADPGPEGYILIAGPDAVVVAGSDDAGAFYGVQSLRQLLRSGPGGVKVAGVRIRDWPYMKVRAARTFLPGRDNIAFFKRFVRDYLALYKYNRIFLEVNATMRLDRHPELNTGSVEFARDMTLRRLNNPLGLWSHHTNASHYDAADGGILEKQEVTEIIRWLEANHIEAVPEISSLSHSYYLLTRHRELAEVPDEEWPDTYCPSLPAVYKLLFDVYDEYLDVFKPKMVLIGHDEWQMPWGVCPRCRDKDPRQLFVQDIQKIHSHLKSKGIRAAMWSDHLFENVRGAGLSKPWWDSKTEYRIPGALSLEQAKSLPKDILMANWTWEETRDPRFPAVSNEERTSDWGFEQIYGNFKPHIQNFVARTKRSKIVGGAVSCWASVSEFVIAKDLLAEFTGVAELLWSGKERTAAERSQVLRSLMPTIRRNLSGHPEPSTTEGIKTISIGRYFNAAVQGRRVVELADAASHDGRFALVAGSQGEGPNPFPQHSPQIPIGEDVSSLVFLHALAKPGTHGNLTRSYRRTFNHADTGDLVGWYEVEYEDGLVVTVPLRYSWNILDLRNETGVVAYQADAVDGPDGSTLYAFEWTNPRLGMVIKNVRLHGSTSFKTWQGKTIPSNAVILVALSAVPSRVKANRPDPPFPK
ncbi:MAG: beta-N-acetylhexosaminidase [Acidobacteria bacterium]|nr:beta-N-acetylhexosaminidase [Acidobacteriota bacterium]